LGLKRVRDENCTVGFLIADEGRLERGPGNCTVGFLIADEGRLERGPGNCTVVFSIVDEHRDSEVKGTAPSISDLVNSNLRGSLKMQRMSENKHMLIANNDEVDESGASGSRRISSILV
jgi:hypothetical protein